LIKGGGGALLREKIVAASADRMIVIADDSKFKTRLGAFPLPVEVVPFGHLTTRARIVNVGAACGHANLNPVLRARSDGAVFETDSGNVIYDCPFGEMHDAPGLAVALSSIAGVVEHGLFCGLARTLVLAGPGGVRVIERSHP
jgi:ribose 5-phosphate isomerase A